MSYSRDIVDESKTRHNTLDQEGFSMGTDRRLNRSIYHKIPPKMPAWDADLKQIREQGYVVLKNVLQPHQIREIKAALTPYLAEYEGGRNNFEGYKTQRVYALLKKSRAFDQLILNPRILYLLDNLLLKHHLLTAFQAIQIRPGESPQPFHTDDQFCKIPRPRQHLSVATIWAIDDFTEENGGTQIVPNSHLWGERKPTPQDELKTVKMEAGSCLVFLSTLWHRGGENVSSRPRLAISSQHCEPYIRPQENQFLVVPRREVAKLHPRIQEMMGYSIHYPFIGHADGYHPLRYIDQESKL